ncbi:hypothetical protein [Novosphingopyxis sp.]|uniref:hypothetical protein n=1 Tax=Novosphingopyxis sp. TaxID=2709690 RepID=UPI003B5C382A
MIDEKADENTILTQTQDRPNRSTEHHGEDDERRPSDTLDRDIEKHGHAGQSMPGDSEQV